MAVEVRFFQRRRVRHNANYVAYAQSTQLYDLPYHGTIKKNIGTIPI